MLMYYAYILFYNLCFMRQVSRFPIRVNEFWITLNYDRLEIDEKITPDERQRIITQYEGYFRAAVEACLERFGEISETMPPSILLNLWNRGTVLLRIIDILWWKTWLSNDQRSLLDKNVRYQDVQKLFWKYMNDAEDVQRVEQRFSSLSYHKTSHPGEYKVNYYIVMEELQKKFPGILLDIHLPSDWYNHFSCDYMRHDDKNWIFKIIRVYCDEILFDRKTRSFYTLLDGKVSKEYFSEKQYSYEKIYEEE